jgi:hypothetical protein
LYDIEGAEGGSVVIVLFTMLAMLAAFAAFTPLAATPVATHTVLPVPDALFAVFLRQTSGTVGVTAGARVATVALARSVAIRTMGRMGGVEAEEPFVVVVGGSPGPGAVTG